uniref:Chromo domain-containing protein n=1 Tax=Quercus lobata TaxID=97700 RepID=A0A7N2MQE9_QUELO
MSLFKVIKKIDQFAYQLDLPPESKLYPVFHLSLLKPKLGQHTSPVPTLPPIDAEGLLSPKPIAVLQQRSKQLRNRIITEVLVQWHGTTTEDATWESLHQLQNQYPHLVGKVL